jgi:hypothetical protein
MSSKAFLLAMLLGLGLAQVALATPIEGVTITDGISTDTLLTSVSDQLLFPDQHDLHGWTVAVLLYTNLNFAVEGAQGMSVVTFVSCASGAACNTNDLTVTASITDFREPGTVGFGAQFLGSPGSISGSASQSMWYSSTNELFSTQTLIGTLGPVSGNFTTPDGIFTGRLPPGLYSLTVAETFSHHSQVRSSLSANIYGTPEPESLLLTAFGFIAAGLWSLARRKDKAIG